MSLVAIGSAKGSPGVTTTAVLLAAGWPDDDVVIVEADPDGGDLGARYGLALEPSLVSAAAAVRRGDGPQDLDRHAQVLPGGIRVVAGPPAADQAVAALGAASHLAESMRALAPMSVLVDCGRLRADSPARPIAEAADLVLVVTRPRLDDLHHVAHLVRTLTEGDVGLVVVGQRPYAPHEIAEVIGAPLFGVLADDRPSADALRLGRGNPRALGRSPLARSAVDSAQQIAAHLGVGDTIGAVG